MRNHPYASNQKPPVGGSPVKSERDKQLEGLNETLQRLGRDKVTGKGNSNKKKKEINKLSTV